MIRFDTLAFLDAHGRPPARNEAISLDAAHVTAAPPFFMSTEHVLEGAEAPSGAEILGIRGFRGFLERQNIVVVETGSQLYETGDGQLRIIMGFQGSPADADQPGNLTRMYDAGLRTIGLGYDRGDHPLGSGFSDTRQSLSPRGRRFVRAIGEAGLILDLSHAGHQAALDALDEARDTGAPVFVSHTGVHSEATPHDRNFPAEVLQGVRELGGTVGIYGLTFALHPEDNSLEPMLDHIHRAVELLGAETVTIGSDGIYQKFSLAELEAQHAKLGKDIDQGLFKARFPSEPLVLNTPDKMFVLEHALRESGLYTEEQIAGILGRNALRFFERTL